MLCRSNNHPDVGWPGRRYKDRESPIEGGGVLLVVLPRLFEQFKTQPIELFEALVVRHQGIPPSQRKGSEVRIHP